MNHPSISVAVPVYNEESNVRLLLERVRGVLDSLPGGPHEMVFVDDGSSDGTLLVLESAAASDPRIRIIVLSRNFGHQVAITAALDHVRGDVTVVMDGDLQDSPEAIEDFLAWYHQGYDVVYARRTRRKEPYWLRLCYRLYYRVLSRMSNVELPLDAGDFGLMSRRVVEQLRTAPERHRYLRGLRAWTGFQQIGVSVARDPRVTGKSKYSIRRLFSLAFDGIFSFSIVPLRLATILGGGAVLLSSVFAAYSVYAKFFLNQSPRGFTALIVVITFVSGVNLVFLGVIGEYLGRVYEQVKGRPMYVINRVVGEESSSAAQPGHKVENRVVP